MRAINHALTGAVIGVTTGTAVVAIPFALVSHFALDAVPHFGINESDIKQNWFRYSLLLDAALCFSLVLILYRTHTQHWQLAVICAFVAASPDFMSIPRYYRTLKHADNSRSSRHWIVRFHHRIQTEIPAGAISEVVWAALMIFVLAQHIS